MCSAHHWIVVQAMSHDDDGLTRPTMAVTMAVWTFVFCFGIASTALVGGFIHTRTRGDKAYAYN